MSKSTAKLGEACFSLFDGAKLRRSPKQNRHPVDMGVAHHVDRVSVVGFSYCALPQRLINRFRHVAIIFAYLRMTEGVA